MIYEINIILIIIAVLLLLPLFERKEGFYEFNFNNQGYIPYVSQDALCMIFTGLGVNVDRYSTFPEKCSTYKKDLKDDNSNICRI